VSILVAVQVHEGMVLAADSAITNAFGTGQSDANVYFGGNKLVNVYKGLPIAVAFCGAASLGPAPMAVVLKDFRERIRCERSADFEQLKRRLSVGDMAARLRAYVYEERYKAIESQLPAAGDRPVMVLWVAGISAAESATELWQITVDSQGQCPPTTCVGPAGNCGVYWSGDKEAISRLMNGIGDAAQAALLGLIPGPIGTQVQQALITASQANLWAPAMPIQDAIELADYLVDSTIRFARFRKGYQTVGGAIDIAAITRHEGFRWVQRKLYFPPELNGG